MYTWPGCMAYCGLARGIRICGGIELYAEPAALYVPRDRSRLGSPTLSRRELGPFVPFRLAIDPRALAGFEALGKGWLIMVRDSVIDILSIRTFFYFVFNSQSAFCAGRTFVKANLIVGCSISRSHAEKCTLHCSRSLNNKLYTLCFIITSSISSILLQWGLLVWLTL